MIIVSGFRRTGTSAMMRALFASLKQDSVLAYTENNKDVGNAFFDGYSPNPTPLLEVGGHARDADFLRELPQNVLIKIFFDAVLNVPAGDHFVVFMERDEEEINESLKRVYEHFDKIGYKGYQRQTDERTFDVYRRYNPEDVQHVIGILEQRKDITLVRINYRDLVTNPRREFQRLKAAGLKLDVEKAASMIDSKHWRARIEHSESRSTGASPNS